MGNTVDTSKGLSQTRQMNGRRVIKTSVREITKDNVVDVLQKALGTHELNRSEIDYLWNYYRGKQPILHRTKEVRPEICNKIVENQRTRLSPSRSATCVVNPFSMSAEMVRKLPQRLSPL